MPEWKTEVNQWGGERRYYIDERGIKTYEMLIDGIPESEFEARKQMEREAAAERIRQDALKKQTEKFVICPLRMMQDCASLRCAPECALHTVDGCGMVSDAALTGGAICPMKPGFKCSAACALYADGCKLKSIFKK